MNNKISISISSNRNNFSRIFENFKSFKCRKILVHGNTISIKNKIPDEWEYYHEPNLNHYQRHYKSIKMITTPYVLEVAEDDVYSIEFINAAIDFLDINLDYVSCRGLVLGFSNTTKEISENCHLTKSQLAIHAKLISDNYHSSDPIERLLYHTNYKNLLNPSRNVKRTEAQLKFMKFLNSNPEYWPINYIDRIYIAHESVFGNIKTLPLLQLLKNQGKRTTIEMELSPTKNFSTIKNHLNEMVKYYVREFNISYNDVESALMSITNKVYYNNNTIENLPNTIKEEIKKIKYELLSKKY